MTTENYVKQITLFIFLLTTTLQLAIAQNSCDPWQYTVCGSDIGLKTLRVQDIDSDGVDEIITATSAYGTRGYWYVLKYNQTKSDYEVVWTSELFQANVTTLNILSMFHDGHSQIAVGTGDGSVIIYDAASRNILKRLSIPGNTGDVTNIEFGDADNDGTENLVASNSAAIYIFDITDYSLVRQIPYGAWDFKIGNVDADTLLELVTSSGLVLSVKDSNVVTKWVYNSSLDYNSWAYVELSDIDKDGKEELFVCQRYNSYLDVFDVDTKSRRYEITNSTGIDAFTLKDLNGDGVDEIIYGDGQWGQVHCMNAITRAQLWQITNPDNGVHSIGIGDVNGDGKPDVIWASNLGSHIFVGDIDSLTITWQDLDIEGPFYGIAIDDIDNDGVNEIVAVSYSSENGGAGIISVFNGVTHELKWQSTPSFLNSIWTGIWGLKIADIDNDGVKEIIIATGDIYTGAVYIIDGVTKTIKASHVYTNENIPEFYMFDVADVDHDGKQDLVAETADSIYVFDPVTFVEKWPALPVEAINISLQSLAVGNITDTAHKQIAYTQQYLHIADPATGQTWQSTQYYTAVALYDFDHDGLQEVVAGDDSGYISIVNGITHQLIRKFQPVKSRVDGIAVADLNNDGNPEFILTSLGTVYFYADSLANIYTENYGGDIGSFSSLKIADADKDGKYEVYFGSQVSLVELLPDCYHCTWFRNAAYKKNRSCAQNADGRIVINTSGAAMPYTYSWNNGASADSLTGLSPGTYIVMINDNSGCSKTDTFQIAQARLLAGINGFAVDCHNNPGGANVTIQEGTPPFTYNWSNGQTTSAISVTSKGAYQVRVMDADSCIAMDSIFINKDSLGIILDHSGMQCNGDTIGSAYITIVQGQSPYSYQWNTGDTTSFIYGLPPGHYFVTVLDGRGCSATDSLYLFNPPEIIISITTTPDTSKTGAHDGSATATVTGGVPPYLYFWNDSAGQTTPTASGLKSGTYEVFVEDSNGCFAQATTYVDTVTGIAPNPPNRGLVLYPSLTHGNLYIFSQLTADASAELKIYTLSGALAESSEFRISAGRINYFDISHLAEGLYIINLSFNGEQYFYKVEKL